MSDIDVAPCLIKEVFIKYTTFILDFVSIRSSLGS